MATTHQSGGGGGPMPVGGSSNSNHPETTTAAPKNPSLVTPKQRQQQQQQQGVERHMTVDKNVVDELLLVCGVIGTATETNSKTGEQYLVPVTDCLNWLQDLQRALRRDEDMYRPISLLLGNWNVVQQKLLPLVLTCRYDTSMVLTIVKILVILTKPLNENTQRAGRLVIDTKSNKVSEDVIQEQKKLRENALAQSDMLTEYKRAIVHHSSHRQQKDQGQGGLLSIFVSLLAEPLSKSGTKRTDADHLTIELVLHLFRNILSAEPILKGSQEASYKCAQLHNDCISLFERELVLEILLVICQEMELRENQQYNLLVMELLHHLLRSQDPTVVARCMLNISTTNSNSEKPTAAATAVEEATTTVPSKGKENNKASSKKAKGGKAPPSVPVARSMSSGSGSLRAQLSRDKQQFQRTAAPARHGNFGGTLMLKRPDGKNQYVSASAMLSKASQNGTTSSMSGPKKRKSRKSDPFIGSGRTLLAHTRAGQTLNAHGGPSAFRAQKTLHRFCQQFLDKCYGPVMKSLKNEFRRESARLEGDGDKVVLFRIIWFFFQWYRVSGYGKIQAKKSAESQQEGGEQNEKDNGTSALGQLIFTMDVFTFSLVLNATTTFTTHKNYTRLAQTVALYTEMMHMLNSMYHSKDSTEHMMALGLMDRLFYGNDPVDRLPKLLSSWLPGTSTREYVCDLAELTYVTLKLLDANKKACEQLVDNDEAAGGQLGGGGNKKGKKKKPQTTDVVKQMMYAAADFDVQSYFLRKIVSNHVVFMYTKLLDQYSVNAPHVNHRIIAFFLRLAKVKVAVAEDDPQVQHTPADGEEPPPKNLLALKTSTLEPMLYNIHLLMVLNKILNDQVIRKDKTYADLLSWAAGIIHNFASSASTTNPMLFVECLFKHPAPHRFAELSTNLYVNDEIRMIAERELLLEEQRRAEELNAGQSDEEDSEEEEEELEFEDMMEVSEPATRSKKKRGADDSDDSSSDDDEETNNNPKQAIAKKKRRQFKKLKKPVANYATSSDEEEEEAELELSKEPSKKDGDQNAAVLEKSEKSKTSGALVDSDDEHSDDNMDQSSKLEEATKEKSLSSKRKSIVDDSSDDEAGDDVDEEAQLTGAAASKSMATSKKSFLDDSSDEENDGDDEPEESSKAPEAKASMAAKSKSVVEDSSDDEEEVESATNTEPNEATTTKSSSPQKSMLESLGDGSDSDDEMILEMAAANEESNEKEMDVAGKADGVDDDSDEDEAES